MQTPAPLAVGLRPPSTWDRDRRSPLCTHAKVDVVLHPLRSELNWPLGDRHALDFAPLRWELPAYLLDAVLGAFLVKNSDSRKRQSAVNSQRE